MRSDQGLHPMGKLSKNVVGGVGGGEILLQDEEASCHSSHRGQSFSLDDMVINIVMG